MFLCKGLEEDLGRRRAWVVSSSRRTRKGWFGCHIVSRPKVGSRWVDGSREWGVVVEVRRDLMRKRPWICKKISPHFFDHQISHMCEMFHPHVTELTICNLTICNLMCHIYVKLIHICVNEQSTYPHLSHICNELSQLCEYNHIPVNTFTDMWITVMWLYSHICEYIYWYSHGCDLRIHIGVNWDSH